MFCHLYIINEISQLIHTYRGTSMDAYEQSANKILCSLFLQCLNSGWLLILKLGGRIPEENEEKNRKSKNVKLL